MGAIYKADNFFIYLPSFAHRNYALFTIVERAHTHILESAIMASSIIAQLQMGKKYQREN